MKRIIVSLLFLLPVASVARADEASKRTKVKELFAIIHVDQVSTQIQGNLDRQMQGLSAHQFGATPTPEQKKQFSDLQTHVDGLVQQTIGWKVVEPDYIKLYSDTYSEPEIDSILSFYKSPGGQAMLSKSSDISTKSIGITQQHMAAIEPQLRQLVQDFVKQTTPASSAPPTLNSLPPSGSTPPSSGSTPPPSASTPPSSSSTPTPSTSTPPKN